jgi:hypothetical protein
MENTSNDLIKRIEDDLNRRKDALLRALTSGDVTARLDEPEEDMRRVRYKFILMETATAYFVDVRSTLDRNYRERRYKTITVRFPKSFCVINKKEKVVELPAWLLRDKKLEEYQV